MQLHVVFHVITKCYQSLILLAFWAKTEFLIKCLTLLDRLRFEKFAHLHH